MPKSGGGQIEAGVVMAHLLQYSVARWQEYTALFQAQEADTQSQIASARAQLAAAQKKFGESSEAVREDVHFRGRRRAGPRDEEMRSKATHRIANGLNNVVNSLQEFSDQAEDSGSGLPSSNMPSMQPFATPGGQ